ncbi:MAG: hypothetical protein HFH29_02640 [Eubacterium sp.]|nr:hypothetical protein [Eubacterium sp.]
MRIRQLKLEVAVLLAAVMTCSAPACAGMPVLTASAAAKAQVRLNVESKTLKVGQKDYKLKLVNNKQNWKIRKVTTTKASVCKPYGRKNTYVLLKGKKKGTATIRVKAVRTVTKNGKKTTKSKWLSCKVRVKQPSPDTNAPDTPEAVDGDVTVSNQTQLENALKNAETRTLRLQTEAADTFTIPKADYKDIALTVDAPNADVVNNGTFQSISVLAIKDSTWLENAAGNIFNVLAKAARIVVQPDADVNSITFSQADAKVSLEVNGNVKSVSFAAPGTDAKVSIAQGGTVSNISVAEDAQRTKVDADVDGSIGNMQLAAPDANIRMAVAKSGTVNGFSMAAQAKNTKADLTINGQVENVSLAAPDADIKVTVTEGGAVSKVAMDAAADSAKVGLDVKGTVSDITFDAQKADVSLAVDDNGKIGNVAVSKEITLAVSGTAKEAIAVKVSAPAKITASAGIALESSADISLVLEKGAEGSSVKITGSLTVKVNIENRTEQSVAVTTPNGRYSISKGSSRDITVFAPSASGDSSWSGSSSSGSSPSGGSSSGGSSSGGSSSGGSSGDQAPGAQKGMVLDHTDFTMKPGQEEAICVSVAPEASGRLKNIRWDSGGGDVVSATRDYSAMNTLKLKAEKVGIAIISVTADVYGPEKDSAILLPNQTKTIIVTVTEDGNAPKQTAKLKLTPKASSIEVNESTEITAEIEAPAGATIGHTNWIYHISEIISPKEAGTDTSFAVTGRLKGIGTVTAITTVKLPDGTTETVAGTVEIEVTDKNAPDPEKVEPYFWLIGANKDGSITPLTVGEECHLSVMDNSRAYGLEMEKVEWTSSDESVVKIDAKRLSETDISGLKSGSSTLTAVVTYTTGPKTFTKTVSNKLIVLEKMPAITVSTAEIVSGDSLTNLISPSTNGVDRGIHIALTRENNENINIAYDNSNYNLHYTWIEASKSAVFQVRYEDDLRKESVEYIVPISIPVQIDSNEYTLYTNLHMKITDSWKKLEVTYDDLSWKRPS